VGSGSKDVGTVADQDDAAASGSTPAEPGPAASAAAESGPAASAAAESGAVSPAEPAGDATGVPAVDAALRRLDDVDATPVEAHVEIFDDVQRQLHEALAELDE
jgi:hypothetical protein